MIRPLGALRNPCSVPRGEPIQRLAAVRSLVAMPPSVDLRPYVSRIIDQTDEGCVGHAFGQALRVRAAVQDIDLDPSDAAIYALARELEDPKQMKLPDVGSYPERAVDALDMWGVVSRTRWPDDIGPSRRVTEDVLESGTVATVAGTYNIATTGASRQADIQMALAAQHPVVFAMSVDESYMNHTTGVWSGMTGPVRGGHAQCIVGYTSDGAIVANSWGRSWADGGFATLAWPWVTSDECHAFYVVTTAPKEVT